MKAKVLNGLLVLTSLFGYLEWGTQNHIFLFQAEADVIQKLFYEPGSVLHPFVLVPLIGQVLLLITIFQKTSNKRLTFISIACLGILLAFMFFIGIISLNLKILASTIPFLALAIYAIIYNRNSSKQDSIN